MAPGLRWPELLWSGDMRRIGGDIVLNKRVDPAILALFNGRSNDDIGMVAFIGPTFCINPSDCLPRTLHVVVDIAPKSNRSVKISKLAQLISYSSKVLGFVWFFQTPMNNMPGIEDKWTDINMVMEFISMFASHSLKHCLKWPVQMKLTQQRSLPPTQSLNHFYNRMWCRFVKELAQNGTQPTNLSIIVWNNGTNWWRYPRCSEVQ